MQFVQINRDAAENAYITVKNSGSRTLAAGEGCKFDFDTANGEGYGNWVEAYGMDASAEKVGAIDLAGVVRLGRRSLLVSTVPFSAMATMMQFS